MVILFPPCWLWFPWWCCSCLCSLKNIQANVEFSKKRYPGGLRLLSKWSNWNYVNYCSSSENLLTLIKQPSTESNSWLSHKLIHKLICKFISSCFQFLNCFCRWFREPVTLLYIIHNAWARLYQFVIKIPVFFCYLSSRSRFLLLFSSILQMDTHTRFL